MESYEVIESIDKEVSIVVKQVQMAIDNVQNQKETLRDKLIKKLTGFKTGPWYNKKEITEEEAEDIVDDGVFCSVEDFLCLRKHIYSEEITDLYEDYDRLTTRKLKELLNLLSELNPNAIINLKSEHWLEITKHSGRHNNKG